MAIASAQRRLRAAKVVRKKLTGGPALPETGGRCTAQDVNRTELFLVEEGFGERFRQAGARSRISGDHAAQR